MADSATDQRRSALEQERAVRDVVAGVVHSLDGRRWEELRDLFADEVETDYTSLFGGEVVRQPADALVGGWRSMLSPLDATQHLLGPIVVELRGGEATARCHVRGHHVLESAPGGSEWMVAGHYVFELGAVDGAWRIRTPKIETLYQSGNRGVLQAAAVRSG